MRFITKLIVVIAVVWCALWAVGSYVIKEGITTWTQDRRVEGWQAQVDTSQGGFPFNITTRLDAIDLTNPQTGGRFAAQGAVVKARTYWPGHVDVALPQTPMVFADANGQVALDLQDGTARMRLRPGLSLETAELQLNSGSWSLAQPEGDLFRGDAIALHAKQSARGSARYDVEMTLPGFALGANLRQMLALPQILPPAFETVTAKGVVVFDAPVSARHMGDTPPQFRQIILDGAQLDWGGIALRAMGAVDVDARGVPSGALDLQAKDWRKLLDLAVNAGILPSDRRGQAELLFTLLAARGAGNPEDLDLKLEFAEGRMALSGLPLGRAPTLRIPAQRQ